MLTYVEKDKNYFDFEFFSQINEERFEFLFQDLDVEYMYETPDYPIGLFVYFKGVSLERLLNAYNEVYGDVYFSHLDGFPLMKRDDFLLEKHKNVSSFMDWLDSFSSGLILVE